MTLHCHLVPAAAIALLTAPIARAQQVIVAEPDPDDGSLIAQPDPSQNAARKPVLAEPYDDADRGANELERAYAERVPRDPWRLILHSENDAKYFVPQDDTDRYYTNGALIAIAGPSDLATTIGSFMPLNDQFDAPRYTGGLVIGQLMFTPEVLTDPEPQPDDHPWAGYLYAGGFVQRADRVKQDRFELQVGVIGKSSQAGKIQNWVHEVLDDPDPQGWGTQHPDEVVVNFELSRTWRHRLFEADRGFALEVLPEIGGAVGTVYRHLEASAMVRVGWGLPDDFGPSRIDRPSTAFGPWSDEFSFYIYGQATGRVSQHNVFLDGNDFRDPVTTVDSHPLVGELRFGVVARVWRHLEIGYSQTFLTEQFETQRELHAYGAWVVNLSIPF